MITIDKQSRLTHKVIVKQKFAREIGQMSRWCHEQYGQRFSLFDRGTFGTDGTWQCVWEDGGDPDGPVRYKFSFDREEDAVLFALRWV